MGNPDDMITIETRCKVCGRMITTEYPDAYQAELAKRLMLIATCSRCKGEKPKPETREASLPYADK